MLSHRLTPQERERLHRLFTELDGVPFTEKAATIKATIDKARATRVELPGQPLRCRLTAYSRS